MAFRLPSSICRCDMRTKGCSFELYSLYSNQNNQAYRASYILFSASRGRRGFGPQPSGREKNNNVKVPREGGISSSQGSQQRKLKIRQNNTTIDEALGLSHGSGGKSKNVVPDRQFEERLEAVRRSALEQKKVEESNAYQEINYDASVESNESSIGLGTKVGVGVAVVVFGLVFAFGDFLPSGSFSPIESTTVENKLTKEEEASLKIRLQQFEATLKMSPNDPDAIEGAAVALSELGEYKRAASLLEKLIEVRPKDQDAYRLLGEVKYELKDYDGSAAAYRSSALQASKSTSLEVLRGLTNALLAAKKPDEAVQLLLASREVLNSRSVEEHASQVNDGSNFDVKMQQVDPIQVELLLGKAYSDWGHISDAVSVYDRLISMYPDDFRGYLAKGVILRENGNVGDAERMFIQARFFAPEKAKALVDRYSRQ